MKKLTFAFVLMSVMFSCKKTPNTPINQPKIISDTLNKKTDSLNILLDSVACNENNKINFSFKGKPIGQFSYCIKDIVGNVYKTVIIGKQQWMAENLKVTKFNDGTDIPYQPDYKYWVQLYSPSWCYYQNKVELNTKYGKLYNWYTTNKEVNGNKNVCPTSWHIPTNDEWIDLINYLDSNSLGGSKANIAGIKMKALDSTSWGKSSLEATNISLFTGLAGGHRGFYNNGDSLGVLGGWWSSTSYSKYDAYYRQLYIKNDDVYIYLASKIYGFYIRCIKD